jgi:putative endonuclease
MEKLYYVYILSSRSRTLYTGVTNDLIRRIAEHREGLASSFTAKYRIHRLVYFEPVRDVRSAITREKAIKYWARAKRVEFDRSNESNLGGSRGGMVSFLSEKSRSLARSG